MARREGEPGAARKPGAARRVARVAGRVLWGTVKVAGRVLWWTGKSGYKLGRQAAEKRRQKAEERPPPRG